MSRPTRACELKSGADETAGGYKASRPTRACELKYCGRRTLETQKQSHAPRGRVS